MNNVHDIRRLDSESRARWARIEAAHEKLAKMQARLDERLQKLSEEAEETRQVSREILRELSKERGENSPASREVIRELPEEREEAGPASRDIFQKLSKEREKTARAMRKTMRICWGEGSVQDRLAQEFFYDALYEDRRIGALKFDKIYEDFEAKRDGRRTEYDLLLTNDELVAVVEVRHNLFCDNVEVMRKIRAPNARYYLRRFSDKKMLFVMAYMTASAGAVPLAHECGYATLLADGQKVRADVSCVRYVGCEEQS